MVSSLVALLAAASGFHAPLLHAPRAAPANGAAVARCRATEVQMINLFGNTGALLLSFFLFSRECVLGVLTAH